MYAERDKNTCNWRSRLISFFSRGAAGVVSTELSPQLGICQRSFVILMDMMGSFCASFNAYINF